MKNLLILIAFILIQNTVFSQEKLYFERYPIPTSVKNKLNYNSSEVVTRIGWHHWERKPFNILSIDEQQGYTLHSYVPFIKTWIYERWGLEDINFSAECRIYATSNVDQMRTLFGGLDRSYCFVIENDTKTVVEQNNKIFAVDDSSIKISYLWLILDKKPSETIPSALTLVCLKEYEHAKKIKFGYWFHRGCSVLNTSVSRLKTNILYSKKYLDGDMDMYWSKTLLTMTEDEWLLLDQSKRDLFDSQAAILTLMVRKEFGQDVLFDLLNKSSNIKVLGFDKYEVFDGKYRSYMKYLTADIVSRKTPDSYLKITNTKGK